MKLTSNDLSILSLIASGVSPASYNLKNRLSADAVQIADFLAPASNPNIYSPEVREIGEELRRQSQIEQSHPAPSSMGEPAY